MPFIHRQLNSAALERGVAVLRRDNAVHEARMVEDAKKRAALTYAEHYPEQARVWTEARLLQEEAEKAREAAAFATHRVPPRRQTQAEKEKERALSEQLGALRLATRDDRIQILSELHNVQHATLEHIHNANMVAAAAARATTEAAAERVVRQLVENAGVQASAAQVNALAAALRPPPGMTPLQRARWATAREAEDADHQTDLEVGRRQATAMRAQENRATHGVPGTLSREERLAIIARQNELAARTPEERDVANALGRHISPRALQFDNVPGSAAVAAVPTALTAANIATMSVNQMRTAARELGVTNASRTDSQRLRVRLLEALAAQPR